MRAVRFCGDAKLVVEEAADPQPDDKSVIVKVHCSGICGSELHAFKGKADEKRPWLNTGHEVAGEVAWAPKGSPFKEGMRVGARVVQGCGECHWCKQGDETACANKRWYASNGHAELFKLGLQGVHIIPEGVAWPAAVILSGDGLGVPARVARRLGDTRGKKVLILGMGPVGLSNVLVQSFRGAEVWGVDIAAYRLNYAKELGAVNTLHAVNDNVLERVLQWTDGFGADIVIVAIGRPESLLQAFKLVRRYGTIMQVGEMPAATINPSFDLIQKEAYLTGSWYYTSSDWKLMLEMHQQGLRYDKLVTHVFPLAEAQKGFDTFIAGESGKVILKAR